MGGVAQAQQKFDGNWSVEVITERGDCDKAYRFPVTIQGGRARYGGSESFAVTGSVAANGSLSGSISRGSQRAKVLAPAAGMPKSAADADCRIFRLPFRRRRPGERRRAGPDNV
jgi:hypothetical protein